MPRNVRLMLAGLLIAMLALPACADNHGEAAGEAAEGREVDLEVIADPAHEQMNQQAPETYRALFHTTAGDFTIEVTRAWSPNGADRFYNLVKNGYYDGNRFFRVVPGFVVQWGVHGDPAVTEAWQDSRDANIEDDQVKHSNTRGKVVFAMRGPNSRTTQLFINFGDNARLDGMGFSPFGEVVGDGMDVVDEIYDEYPNLDGRQFRDPETAVSQLDLMERGNAYLDRFFPELDHIITATIVEDAAEESAEDAPEESDGAEDESDGE